MGPGLFAVSRQINRQLASLLCVEVEEIQEAAVLEHDLVGPKAGPVHIELRIVRQLFNLAGVEAIAVQVQAMFGPAIGIEVDGVAVPHGKRVSPILVRHNVDSAALEIINCDVLGHAALVTLPGAEVAEDAVVGDAVTVRRVRGQAAFVERQRLGKSALDADAIQPSEPVVEGVATGEKDDALAVRRPGNDLVMKAHAFVKMTASGIKGQLFRIAAFRRHDIDVEVAVVLSGKSRSEEHTSELQSPCNL